MWLLWRPFCILQKHWCGGVSKQMWLHLRIYCFCVKAHCNSSRDEQFSNCQGKCPTNMPGNLFILGLETFREKKNVTFNTVRSLTHHSSQHCLNMSGLFTSYCVTVPPPLPRSPPFLLFLFLRRKLFIISTHFSFIPWEASFKCRGLYR